MKFELFIVTYQNDVLLTRCLESIHETYLSIVDDVLNITIINNYDILTLDPKFSYVKVMHNVMRPDWATGHLAR